MKIPRAAALVVQEIRNKVSRPRKLPRPCNGQITCLRWNGRCPMGLLEESRRGTPWVPRDFIKGPLAVRTAGASILAFYTWWDSINEDNALNAMNALWPKRERRKKKP